MLGWHEVRKWVEIGFLEMGRGEVLGGGSLGVWHGTYYLVMAYLVMAQRQSPQRHRPRVRYGLYS